MTQIRRKAAVVIIWAAGWNLRALAVVITAVTGREAVQPAQPLSLPVETVTQQLRTIDALMQRIGRP